MVKGWWMEMDVTSENSRERNEEAVDGCLIPGCHTLCLRHEANIYHVTQAIEQTRQTIT